MWRVASLPRHYSYVTLGLHQCDTLQTLQPTPTLIPTFKHRHSFIEMILKQNLHIISNVECSTSLKKLHIQQNDRCNGFLVFL